MTSLSLSKYNFEDLLELLLKIQVVAAIYKEEQNRPTYITRLLMSIFYPAYDFLGVGSHFF
jgi:hypothetical protein